jgi:hypothetical protein
MRPRSGELATPSNSRSLQLDPPTPRDQLGSLMALTKRLEADTILLSGDRDAALREIAQLRLLLGRSLPAIGVRAECGDDPAARELSMEIRAALRQ